MQILGVSTQPITERMIENCMRFPLAVALKFRGQELSYEELGQRANRVANFLAQLGVTEGDAVAICMERSFDWITYALGTMLARAAFVPLDAEWPASRLQFALQDSGAKVVVARSILSQKLDLSIPAIDPSRAEVDLASAAIVDHRAPEPESIAYIIYTSGSTGTPKGVELTHANLTHLLQWHESAFRVAPGDRVSHMAGLGFDAAIWEIWGNLAAGCTLCLAEDEVRTSPQLIQEWILREQITVGFVPTVHATKLISMKWPKTTALRLLLTGGDTLPQAPPVGLPFQLINNYGPTECTVVSTSAPVDAGLRSVPPIGRPISGTSIYLLDEQGRQVADGEPGEIYIAGRGVGRGYRNRPDLTETFFLSDPFAGDGASRMYRSGDRGLRLPDGQIKFLGRNDRQVKIRGQRVELDEISLCLNRHTSLAFAAVTVVRSASGESQLVAYYLPRKELPVPSVQQLQEHLLLSLPSYMVPATFMQIEVLPLSKSGKIDLTLLPTPTLSSEVRSQEPQEKLTPIEFEVIAVIRELLNSNTLQVNDNFFLAGGHSLLSMQLILRMRTTFQVDLTLRQLFEAPTPARLAELIETRQLEQKLVEVWKDVLGVAEIKQNETFFDQGGDADRLQLLQQRISAQLECSIPIAELSTHSSIAQQLHLIRRPAATEPVLPPGVMALQPLGAQRNIFWVHYLSANLPKVLGNDQPFFHVSLTSDDFESLGESPTMERIAASFVSKIRATQPEGPYTLGGFCLGGILAYEIAIQLRRGGQEVSLLVLIDPPSPAYLKMRDPIAPKLLQLNYIRKRMMSLGVKTSLKRLKDRILKDPARPNGPTFTSTEMSQAQDLIYAASWDYNPQMYSGDVLLFLAKVRPPHVDFLPGWQAVIPNTLQSHYIDGHHSELTKSPGVLIIAKTISSYLDSVEAETFQAAS